MGKEMVIRIRDAKDGKVSVVCEPTVMELSTMHEKGHKWTAAEGVFVAAMNYIWRNMKQPGEKKTHEIITPY